MYLQCLLIALTMHFPSPAQGPLLILLLLLSVLNTLIPIQYYPLKCWLILLVLYHVCLVQMPVAAESLSARVISCQEENISQHSSLPLLLGFSLTPLL